MISKTDNTDIYDNLGIKKVKIEKIEDFKGATDEDIEKLRRKLEMTKEKIFSPSYILKNLNTKDSLRKVFLSVFKNNPTKISEICEDTLYYKQNIYPLLASLVNLNLLKRVFVVDIINKKFKIENADDEEVIKEIMEKFDTWTKTMPEGTKRYYTAKTSYWKLTDFGKKFIIKAYHFDEQAKEKEENEME